jgi:CRP/FNR family transcriptional regulator, cyclic AMP receptor protein
MISPEILRRYPIFGVFNEAQLRTLAMITEEMRIPKDKTIFEENNPANELFFLVEGGIDLINIVQEQIRPENRREFSAGEVNPGELFGVSSFIKPFKYTTSAKTNTDSTVLIIDVVKLKNVIENDTVLGYLMIQQVAQQLLERLNLLRIQIATV